MKIAVTYEAGNVFQHFGHTPAFKIFTTCGDKIESAQVVETAGSGHGALAGFLKAQGADVLICGGIGGGARTALASEGIALYPGVSGDADEAVELFLANCLNYDPNTRCSHHDSHHGAEHDCGNHSCGNCGH